MDLLLLIFYGAINITMILWYLRGKGEFYKLPFWAGLIALGWFFPQAIGGYFNNYEFPNYAYANGMLFASLCSLALWGGWVFAYRKPLNPHSWLSMTFNSKRLYYVGAFLCIAGFYFQWKLWSLPEEMLSNTQWSGVTVQYHFLGGIFKYGFLILWFLYLSNHKRMSPRFLIFLIPCFLLLIEAAVLRGRRAEMMNLTSYILITLWFVWRFAIPRWLLIIGLLGGMILINGIGTYRSIMKNQDLILSDRIDLALNADYLSASNNKVDNSGEEFKNYIYYRAAIEEDSTFDYGGYHWNQFVFNYVPAQIVGAAVKSSLMLPINNTNQLMQNKYGHSSHPGTTLTGYSDAFASFSWLGFLKFAFIGLISGVLFRYAMSGNLLGQLLYVSALSLAMHAVTHGTNEFLMRIWVYFFILVFPAMCWAKVRSKEVL